jgi:DedD protein
MEREMKKLILVTVSVGVFLVVIVSAAILFLTPKVQTEETAFSSSKANSMGRVQPGFGTSSERVKDFEGAADIQPSAMINNTQGTDFYTNGESYAYEADKTDGDRVTIKIPKPTTAAVPDNYPAAKPAVAAKPAPAASKSTGNVPARPAPAPAPKPAATATAKPAATVAAPAAKPASASTSKPADAKTATNDYWVQTGAFTVKIRAEDAKETLASSGITSIIENRIVDGKTWYRVRLGPYTSEKEANYWLALVQSIDGFSESQVRQTVRR